MPTGASFCAAWEAGWGPWPWPICWPAAGCWPPKGRSPKTPLAPRAGHFPARAKSIIWLFMEGGPSGFDLFDPKPRAQQTVGPAGRQHRDPLRQSRPAVGLAVFVPAIWPERNLGLRSLSGAGRPRRRHRVDQIGPCRVAQSCAGHVSDEYRFDPARLSQCRCLGDLRPGKRKPGSARLCRFAPQRRQGRTEQLGLGLSARLVPSDAVANQWATDFEFGPPGRRIAGATSGRCSIWLPG